MPTTRKPADGGTKAEEKPKPIVYERSSSDDDDDREYSDGTKDAQKVLEGAVDATEKLVRAFADGVTTYKTKHHESASKKEDGAIRDFVENFGEGVSDALDTAADAPRELTKKVTLKRLTRLVTPMPLNVFLRR